MWEKGPTEAKSEGERRVRVVCNEMSRSLMSPRALLCHPRDTGRDADLCVDGGCEVAEQSHVVLLAGLHVHH